MSFRSRIVAVLFAATLGVAPTLMAQAPATQPAAARDYTIVAPELKAAKAELAALIKLPAGLSTLRDPAVREKLATELPPILRKVSILDAEAAIARAEFAKTSGMVMMGSPSFAFDAATRDLVLLALKDPESVKETTAAIDSTDATVSRDAKAQLAATDYIIAAEESAQIAAVDKLTPLYVAADGKDEKLDTMLAVLMMTKGAAPAAEDHLNKMISSATPGKYVNTIVRQRAGDAKQKAAVGKPATFAGVTAEGKTVDTASMKGKVILIDFWASWCGPCKAELPRVKELYAKYHEQGLEVVGISNDYSADALTNYLANNPLPWPSIYDDASATAHKWHPLTQKYGINGIPVMFLIDRKGVIRSVTARSQLEKLIPELIKESAESGT